MPERLGADADPPAVQRGHGDPEALVDLAEHGIGRHAAVLEEDLGRARGANAELLLLGAGAQPGRFGGTRNAVMPRAFATVVLVSAYTRYSPASPPLVIQLLVPFST